MKKILIMFFVISLNLFSLEKFPLLNWGDSVFKVKLEHPGTKEIKSEYGKTSLTEETPREKIQRQNFYFQNGNLYEIEIKYNDKVNFDDLENIYTELVRIYGNCENKVLEYCEDSFCFSGNEKIWYKGDSIIILKGLDKSSSDGKIVSTGLYLIYRDINFKK